MTTLKIAALVLGAGILLEVFSPPDFFPDFVLVIAAGLSHAAESPPDFSSDGLSVGFRCRGTRYGSAIDS